MNKKILYTCTFLLTHQLMGASLTLESNKDVLVPTRLGAVTVTYDGNFNVHKDGETQTIQPYNLTKTIRDWDLNSDKLSAYLSHGGYFQLRQKDDGEYALVDQMRLLGGGPIFGLLVGLGNAAAVVGCALHGNAPGVLAVVYSAAITIPAAMAAPTP